MNKTAMQLRTIADRLYGIRLPAFETGATNTILMSAAELNKLADEAEKENAPEKAENAEEK